jgi:hypothetical protein
MPCGSIVRPCSNYECSSGQGASLKTLLFATIEGSPLSPNAQSAAWADFADGIDMPDVTFHAVRLHSRLATHRCWRRYPHHQQALGTRQARHYIACLRAPVPQRRQQSCSSDRCGLGGAAQGLTGPSLQQGRISKWHRALLKRLGMLKKQRNEAKTPEARQEVIASQITDALLGIQWMLVSIADSMNRMERNK